MKALVLKAKDEPVVYGDWSEPEPKEGEVIVDLKAAAMNHRDVFITQGLYPGIVYPIILGSDGAGVYDGREVVINPGRDWGSNPNAQAKTYAILGLPQHGTFAEKVRVPADRLHDKPSHLTWAQAAALPLAGLTAYRSVFTRGALQAGEKVLIHGIGGGVALFAMQFALAAGAEVYVTSGSEAKIQRAIELGAKQGISYKEEGWERTLAKASGGFDLIVESAGGAGYNALLYCAAPGGRIVSYGGTAGKIPSLSPQKIFWKQLSLLGSTMGTDQDFADMIRFVQEKKIVPVVDSETPLSEGGQGFQRMADGLQFGKIVFQVG